MLLPSKDAFSFLVGKRLVAECCFFVAKPALNIIYIQFYRISVLTTVRKMIFGKTKNGADTTFTLHGRADPCAV